MWAAPPDFPTVLSPLFTAYKKGNLAEGVYIWGFFQHRFQKLADVG